MIFFVILFFLLALRFHLNRNRYIISHKEYIKNEDHYLKYLEWCLKRDHIPMDKKIFNKEIENRNHKLNKLWKD